MDLTTANKQMTAILEMFRDATTDDLIMYKQQFEPIAEMALEVGLYLSKLNPHERK
jgi:hypothetical protein